jgi:cell fate regulator YaaT (PSP1 superfamily)
MNAFCSEYLVRYGKAGEFGRFHAQKPLQLLKGDLVIIETHRGKETGEILSPSTPIIAKFLPNTTVGKLYGTLTDQDDSQVQLNHAKSSLIIEAAKSIALNLALPVSILDAELLFDGKHAVLHLATSPKTDVRDLISKLSNDFDLHIYVENITQPNQDDDHDESLVEDAGSCGSGNCGSKEGGCGSCSSGGGCGSCSTTKEKKPALEANASQRKPLI